MKIKIMDNKFEINKIKIEVKQNIRKNLLKAS